MMISMLLRHEIHYNASAAEVYAMLTDPAFRSKALAAMGVISHEITITAEGSATRILIDQVQPTEGVPSFAKKFAGETTRAVQTEVWSSPTSATLKVDAPGKPTEISGTLTLTESGGKTTEVFEGEVKARVPLIGGKLENVIAGLFTAGFDKENAAGIAWLAGDR
jgi:uncharacterized protein YndB with AHSA1/START domain